MYPQWRLVRHVLKLELLLKLLEGSGWLVHAPSVEDLSEEYSGFCGPGVDPRHCVDIVRLSCRPLGGFLALWEVRKV